MHVSANPRPELKKLRTFVPQKSDGGRILPVVEETLRASEIERPDERGPAAAAWLPEKCAICMVTEGLDGVGALLAAGEEGPIQMEHAAREVPSMLAKEHALSALIQRPGCQPFKLLPHGLIV